MSNANKTIKEAVKDAQHTLAEYVQPGERDCEQTVQKLLTTLDNNEVAEAIMDSDEEERARGRRSEKPGTARPQPHQH